MTSNETSQRLANESTAMETIDLALLEKICEEAMEMTIREALLHSVDPKVKKDLIEGQFKLTPGEVRGLEIYCEALIGNLVTESIESLNNRNNGRSRRKPLKTNTAKDLSEVDLEILTRNCERILEAIITESLQDSSRILSSESVDSKTMISLEEMQAEEIVSTLVDFQGSKKVQRYIGHLTADIVKTALSNVAVTMAACKKQRNVEDADSEVTKTFHGTCDTNGDHSKLTDCLQRPSERHQMVSYFNGTGSESFHKKQTDDYFSDSDSDIEGQKVDYSCHGDQMGFSSLEYDSEWEHQHGLSTQLHDSIGKGKKQRILLQELSFDETVEVKGSELMAPVFLAIAEEDLYDDDEEFQHMRRKAQSIEDLCHILKDEEISDSRPRSISLQNLNRAKDFTPFRFPTEESAPVKTLSSSLSDVEVEFDESDSMTDASDGEDEYFYSDGEGEGNVSRGPHLIPQTGDFKEYRWHTVTLAGREKVLDLKALEPYMKVITHGGYYKKAEKSVIVVITACYLPGRNHPKYQFLMEQLFFYVMSTIELLATSTDYYIVYLNGGTTQKNTPSVNWMKKFYQYIDRHQRKNMLRMFVVHPTFWLKALIRLAKAFMSPQFWQKLDFVHSLRELAEHVPLDYMFIPDEVVRSDPLYRQQHGI